MTKKIMLCDVSLRDGNHRVKHNISPHQIARYVKFSDNSNVNIIEVGHGNGLGASSIQLGLSKTTDIKCL